MRRAVPPPHSEREATVFAIEACDAATDLVSDRRCARPFRPYRHGREIAERQKRRVREEQRVAADLNAVLRRADAGRADRFDGTQHFELGEPALDRASKTQAKIAKFRALKAVDVLADAAGEHQSVERTARDERLGEPERRVVKGPSSGDAECEIGDPLRDRIERSIVALVAGGDLHASVRRDARAGAGDRADRARVVPGHEARTHVDRRCLLYATVATDRELCRPATDVDVQYERC